MHEEWYSQSMLNNDPSLDEEFCPDELRFKKEYCLLKRKFQCLIYENESLMQALRLAQKRLLGITRDRTFLLDRLLLHEKVDNSTSESEATESSEDEVPRADPVKKRKSEQLHYTNGVPTSVPKVQSTPRRRKPPNAKSPRVIVQKTACNTAGQCLTSKEPLADGHMTPEEVERHLQSQSYMDLMPERAPLTVPTEMFSNDPSLDSESNDVGETETSPSNVEEELGPDILQE